MPLSKEVFDSLAHGSMLMLTIENIGKLNELAMRLYNTPNLSPSDVEELKYLLMASNIVYNRTDSEGNLIISDGMYDILLEKYKKYDPNFQVGSAVVDFKNTIEVTAADPTKLPEEALVFHKKVDRDEFHQEIFDNLIKSDYISKEDFYESPLVWLDLDASKRTHDTEHNHPALVGTLDKAKFVLNNDAIKAGVFEDPDIEILERDFFQDHINKGIISPNQKIGVVVELKYDGVSVEADCGMEVISARTRGDTNIGKASDLTNLLRGYQFKHARCMIGQEPIGVKFEAIMTKFDLERFNLLRGKSYSNCRTAIIGLFGALDGYLYRDLITLVPLAVDRAQTPYISNRLEEIEFLNKVFISNGQPLRYQYFYGTVTEVLYCIKAFWDEAKIARDYLPFMYDGIVVSYTDESIRNILGRKNSINKYSIAVKFDPLEKQTRFRGYTFEVGQNGQITPMIHYDPVEFIGTIHTKSSGSSYERFRSLNLKYGDFINVTYRNDVMPYVSRIECDYNRNNPNPVVPFIDKCPVCGGPLYPSDSGKLMYCINVRCTARVQTRLVNMMHKLNKKGFAEATFRALPDITHLHQLYDHDVNYYIERLGNADGASLVQSLNELKTEPIYDYIIIGALGFTGIAQRKWKSLLEQVSIHDLYIAYNGCKDNGCLFREYLVKTIPSIGEVTANIIADEFDYFKDDIEMILSWNNIINSSDTSNSTSRLEIRFSGIRNLQLSELLNNKGYDADPDGSVTKSTNILIIPYDGFTSGKVQKAKKYGTCIVVPITEFIDNSKEYLGEDIYK